MNRTHTSPKWPSQVSIQNRRAPDVTSEEKNILTAVVVVNGIGNVLPRKDDIFLIFCIILTLFAIKSIKYSPKISKKKIHFLIKIAVVVVNHVYFKRMQYLKYLFPPKKSLFLNV